MRKYGKKPINKWLLLYISIVAVVILLNIIAWNSTAFCDAYIAGIFPVWVNTYGRLTGVFSFSVGEIMLVLAVVLTVVASLLWILLFVKRMRKGIRRFYLFYVWTFLIVCIIMTLNCFILYHASTFSETYFGEDDGEYTVDELITVRNMVVEECNRLALEMERDEDGTILYDKDLGQESVKYMKELGKIYGRLSGYYPEPKPLYASDFFS